LFIEGLEHVPIVDAAARGLGPRHSWWNRKESALKKALLMAKQAAYGLAPAFLAFGFFIVMGKRW
jgi:hypothetical protein